MRYRQEREEVLAIVLVQRGKRGRVAGGYHLERVCEYQSGILVAVSCRMFKRHFTISPSSRACFNQVPSM